MGQIENCLDEILEVLEEGGGGTNIVPLTADTNGTYTAPSGTAYSPVSVNVPSVRNIEVVATEEKPFGDLTHQEILDIISLCKQGKGTILLSCKSEMTGSTGYDNIVREPLLALTNNAILWTKAFGDGTVYLFEWEFQPDEILTYNLVTTLDSTNMTYSQTANLVLSNIKYNISTW